MQNKKVTRIGWTLRSPCVFLQSVLGNFPLMADSLTSEKQIISMLDATEFFCYDVKRTDLGKTL